MKNIFRISAFLIALTVMAAIVSCQPDVSITEFDYKKANTAQRPEASGNQTLTGTGNNGLIPRSVDVVCNVGSEYVEAGNKIVNPIVKVTFPPRADFHKDISMENTAKSADILKKFLSFYEYENEDTDAAWRARGKASTLKGKLDYTLKNIQGYEVELELDKTFETEFKRPSVVMKIDSTKYTHSGGFKIDRDQNSIGGEAGYDDVHYVLPGFNGVAFEEPIGRNWNFNLTATGFLQPLLTLEFNDANKRWFSLWADVDAKQTTTCTFRAGTVSLVAAPPITGITNNTTAMGTGTPYTQEYLDACKEVAELVLAGGVVLQKTDGTGKWTDTIYKAVYDFDLDDGLNRIAANLLFKDVVLEKDTNYRVKWTGKANLVTKGEYYGVRQKVFVSGETPSISGNNRNESRYKFREVISAENGIVRNRHETAPTEIVAGSTPAPIKSVSAEAKTENGGDVTLRVEFPIYGDGLDGNPLVGLSELAPADFKKAFKVVYRSDDTTLNSNFGLYLQANNVVEVEILGVEFKAEDYKNGAVDVTNTTLNNVIYITLGSNFKYNNLVRNISFLINDGLKYEDKGFSVRQFGDRTNIKYDKFRLYSVVLPPIAKLLAIGTWENGNIALSATNNSTYEWYEFTATQATQNFWVMAAGSSLTYIYYQLYNENYDLVGGWNSVYFNNGPVMFSRTGLTAGSKYYLRVTYYAGTGAYRISFNNSGTVAPVLPAPWSEVYNFPTDAPLDIPFTSTGTQVRIWLCRSGGSDVQATNVELLDDKGTSFGVYALWDIRSNNNSQYTSFTVTEKTQYIIRLTSYAPSYTGNFQVAITDNTVIRAP